MKEVTAAIDIGGTYTKFGLVDINGNCLKEGIVNTIDYEDINLFVQDVHAEINKIVESLDLKVIIKGVGIGVPNGNYYSGKIEHAANLKWKGIVPLVDLFQPYYNDIPITLTNDANAAALGEMFFGGGREVKNFIVITLGTGLGSGIVVNGELVYGHDGFAGELGHVTVEEGGRICGFGRRGSLETYVSATGIKRTAFALMADTNMQSSLQHFTYHDLTSEDIYNAAIEGDKLARECFEITGRYLGRALANSVAHLSPEVIFLFGGLAKAGDMIFEPTRRHMEEHLLPVYKNKIKIKASGLLNVNAAVMGAGALAWKEIKNNAL